MIPTYPRLLKARWSQRRPVVSVSWALCFAEWQAAPLRNGLSESLGPPDPSPAFLAEKCAVLTVSHGRYKGRAVCSPLCFLITWGCKPSNGVAHRDCSRSQARGRCPTAWRLLQWKLIFCNATDYSSEDIVEGGLRFSHNCVFSVVAVAVHRGVMHLSYISTMFPWQMLHERLQEKNKTTQCLLNLL